MATSQDLTICQVYIIVKEDLIDIVQKYLTRYNGEETIGVFCINND